jgi:branched-chain amino acid transport system ATP-binding protein
MSEDRGENRDEYRGEFRDEGVILYVEGLSAAYGQAQILFDVSLSLRRGQVSALLGRNGAGKSTTLKAIMRLISQRARALRFDGRDIRRLPTYRIARLGLGYVPEDRRIFTDLTVGENLLVGAKAAIGSEHAPWNEERLFAVFPNLAPMRGRRASQMSGGEQQMLAIARTLMGNPRAVLLDEPSEGLAPVIVEHMAEAIAGMKREGIAVLLCEQNVQFAAAVADHATIIEKGAIRHQGRMDAIMADASLREAYLAP